MPKKHRDSRVAIEIAVQIATSRKGVPHASSLSQWARSAYVASRRRKAVGAELTIRVIGAAESRRLNRTWRAKDKPTNVLSFPGDGLSPSAPYALQPTVAVLGDLAICAPVVAREAREQGKQVQAHWAHMVIHGVLHLMGYDHENDRDARAMESLETRVLAQLGYPHPYESNA
jgi:probable rRNA maturation factor